MLYQISFLQTSVLQCNAPYCERQTNVFYMLADQRERIQLTGTPPDKVEHNKLILSLCVYPKSVKLVIKYEDFIYFIASHVSAVTKIIIRISW